MFMKSNERISRLSIYSIARHNRTRVFEGDNKRRVVAKAANPFTPRLSVHELVERLSLLPEAD